MNRLGLKVNDRNTEQIFASRLYIGIDGQEFVLINRDGKLEIIADKSIKLTMGGGCNMIYISEE